MKWYQDTLQAVQTPIPNFILLYSLRKRFYAAVKSDIITE